MTLSQWVALGVFAVAYIAIASDVLHRTHAALAGAALMLVLGLVDQHSAFHGGIVQGTVRGELRELHVEGVDWNTIFLLVGMIVIVNITRETGVFQYLAIRAAKAGRGRPVPIIILLALVTAFLAAFIDSVTAILLIVPVTLLIADNLEKDPVPFVICEVIASNAGGTATLVGNPPNIMIAGAAGLTFPDFVRHMTPVALIILASISGTLWLVLRRRITVTEEQRQRILSLDEREAITDWGLLKQCLIVLALTIGGFIVHARLGLKPATIALAGAVVLMLWTRRDPQPTLEEIEWPTLFFFFGLFIIVSGLVAQGVIALMAEEVLTITHSPSVMTQIILWFSGVASAVVDNIPFVATMNPLIADLSHNMGMGHDPSANPLWWALALGGSLGGNGTLIGASANVAAAGICGRSGHAVSFKRYLKYGIPLTLQSLLISWVYMMWRYF